MSEIILNNIVNLQGDGPPSFPKGVSVDAIGVTGILTGPGAEFTGVVTAQSFRGDGSQLTGVSGGGGGIGEPVTGDTSGLFNSLRPNVVYNDQIQLNDGNSGIGPRFITVAEPTIIVGNTGDIWVGTGKTVIIDVCDIEPYIRPVRT